MKEKYSIWGTVEVDAWSRDFNYDNYINLHKQYNCAGNPMTFDGYARLCELLEIEYEDSLK